MRTNLNPFMYINRKPLDWLETIPGTYPLILQPGQYQFALCGGGGAGGTGGGTSSEAGGNGGGGGNGDYVLINENLPYGASLIITVPTGGLTYANGGNGGGGGGGDTVGGTGGGGGAPAIVKILTNSQAFYWENGLYTYSNDGSDNRVYDKNGEVLTDWSVVWSLTPDFVGLKPTFSRQSDGYVYVPTGYSLTTLPYVQYLFANGGGGGGGGGAGSAHGRYKWGSGGGGGGGYYYFNAENLQTISVPGKTGASGGTRHGAGKNGVSGNQQFPSLASGKGSAGDEGGGGGGASGGGASGGGGGASRNDASGRAGAGGGGAPGSPTAHGGYRGQGGTYTAGNGTNPDKSGTPSINPDGESVSGGFGAGGNMNENGFPGWVRIIQIRKPKQIQDLGLVTESVSTIRDNGLTTETVDTIQDLGGIK